MTGEIMLPDDDINPTKIGYSTTENVRKFAFSPDEKPVLIIEPGQSKSELEQVAAIRRVTKHHTDDE